MDKKYDVEIKKAQKALKIPKEKIDSLKGLSGKLLSSMKKEYVDCPVIKGQVPFIVCYQCPSFIRRYRGTVHCAGENGPY
ncbi:MAG: hypothetical protein QXY52_04140 [Conexivisphaerales archaeon]